MPWASASMASFLVLLLLAVSEGRRYGWGSQMIVTLFGIAGVSLLIFVITELKTTEPFVDLRLYTNYPLRHGMPDRLLEHPGISWHELSHADHAAADFSLYPVSGWPVFPATGAGDGRHLDPRRTAVGQNPTQVPPHCRSAGTHVRVVPVLRHRCLGHRRVSSSG